LKGIKSRPLWPSMVLVGSSYRSSKQPIALVLTFNTVSIRSRINFRSDGGDQILVVEIDIGIECSRQI